MSKHLKSKIYVISKKAADVTGIDIPYFVENGFWTFTNQLINLAVGFLLYIVFAKYLSKEIFGQYNLVLSFIGIFSVFSFPGLNTSISHSVAKGMTGSYLSAIKYSFKWSLLGTIALILVGCCYFIDNNYDLFLSVFIAAAFFPVINSFSKWNAFLIGKSLFVKIAKYSIIQNVSIFIILALVVVFFPHSVIYIIAPYIMGNSLFNYLWHLKAKARISDNKLDDGCIPYGKFFTKAILINTIVLHFDKIIVGFLNIELLAVFSIALKLIDSLKSLVKSVYSISFSKFVNQNVTIKIFHIIILMLVGLFISIFMYSVSELLLVFLFGNKYIGAVGLFDKLIFIMPLVAVSALLNTKINAEKNKNKILLINTIVPVSSLIVSILTFILTNNLEYFIISKVYTTQLAYFLILVPKYKLFKRN